MLLCVYSFYFFQSRSLLPTIFSKIKLGKERGKMNLSMCEHVNETSERIKRNERVAIMK